MEYINFGSAGVKVSPLALGLGFRGLNDAGEAQRVIEHAIDRGINLIDCANFYGLSGGARTRSEEILARVLETRRDDLVITSKVRGQIGPGPNDEGSSRYHILREAERSLKRLGTDRIDVYLLHSFDDATPLEETVRALDDLVTQGKVRYVGCCNFAAWQVCNALWTADRVGADPIICIQQPYSLLNRSIETEHFGLVREQGLGVMAFSPLGAGLLSGDYTVGERPPPSSLWASKDQARFESSMSGLTPAVLSELHSIGANHGKTPGQVALRWVLSHREITVAIFGSDTTQHVDDNLGALDWELGQDEVTRLNDASQGSNVQFTNL